MEDKRKKVIFGIIKYALAIFFATALALLVLWIREVKKLTDIVEIYRAYADAFTIPGLLLICLGILVSISNEGALDFIGYAFRWLAQTLIPFLHLEHLTYYEYINGRKREKGYGFIYIVGLIFLAIGIVFIVLFYKVYNA